MTPFRHLLVLLALLSAPALPAFAQDATEEDPEPEVSAPAPDAYDRLLAVAVTGGVDTPLGIIGAQLEIAPIRYFGVYAGAGVGRDGVRLGAGVQGRFPVDRIAVGALAGLHAGPLDWDSRGLDQAQIHRYWEFALFLHAGLSVEYRLPEGFFGRLAFGIDALLTPNDTTSCSFDTGGDCSATDDNLFKPVRGWAGLTLGYALEL